ncbi:MAG: TRAP transporter small permease [Rhizobiaceae bacterium]|nr:TRAP transporter small permease [Rhizobiaceae bacterium]
MSPLATFNRRVERVLHAMAWISGAFLVLMAVHVCADVFMRNVFNKPLPGTLEIVSSHYMVYSVFLPLPFVEWHRKSIVVDLFFNAMPRAMKLFCVVVVLVMMTVVYAGFTWQTWGDAVKSYLRGEYLMGGTVQIVVWQARFILPLAFATATLVVFWQLLGVLLGFDRESWLEPMDVEELAPE